MEQLIKVLLYLSKDYCSKNAPSKKEIAKLMSCLMGEGIIFAPWDVIHPKKWDDITAALAQYSMRDITTMKAVELKTWGLVLGSLKVAREEGKLTCTVRDLDNLEKVTGGKGRSGGSSLFTVDHMEKTAQQRPSDSNKMVPDNDQNKTVPLEPPQPAESPVPMSTPPPYPLLYPSLSALPPSAGRDNPVITPNHSKADPCHPPRNHSSEGGAWSQSQITDWAGIREALAGSSASDAVVLPVVVEEGGPLWVPLDPKSVARLIEAIEKKGLGSPLMLNVLELLAGARARDTASGPWLPYDIESLMHIVLKPVHFTVWKKEWANHLNLITATVQNDPRHPVYGTNVQRMLGTAAGLITPQGQVAPLSPEELIATSDATLAALRKFIQSTEPPSPWTDISQGLMESFQDFTDRLIQVVEGSDLPRAVHNAVILDCLQQRSLDDIKTLLSMAPVKFQTPGEAIKYILDRVKISPVTNEGLASAMVNAMATFGQQ
ncbi:uncharacterized protein LOC136054291 [Cyrtonyx montezumae]|uniref:uncharacterized protein LOC136054291 n=1 Tax=Cyrtonyx montezumae TaxID=9017 RepID=UPI0032DA6439